MKVCFVCGNLFESKGWECYHCKSLPQIKEGYPSFAPELSSDDGFRDEIFHDLFRMESSNFWFQARNNLIIWALSCYFPKATNFLEVGCGTGFVMSGINAAKIGIGLYGSEISTAGLKYAAERVPCAEFFQMDARAIPFSGEFDVVGAFDVLEHIEDDDVVLSQLYRSIKNGGGAIFTVPQHAWLWSGADEYACHVRRYNINELKNKALKAGFRIATSTSFVSLLLPAMLASRMLTRGDEGSRVRAELNLPDKINQAFSKIMTLELKLIKMGIRFPIGGSQLLVVRKD